MLRGEGVSWNSSSCAFLHFLPWPALVYLLFLFPLRFKEMFFIVRFVCCTLYQPPDPQVLEAALLLPGQRCGHRDVVLPSGFENTTRPELAGGSKVNKINNSGSNDCYNDEGGKGAQEGKQGAKRNAHRP